MIAHIDEQFPAASAEQENPPVADLPAEAPPTLTTVEGDYAAGGLTCRIMPHDQGTDEWKDARRRIFTASEVGISLVEEPRCRLLKKDLLMELETLGIEANPKATNEELEKLFPDITPYLSFSELFHKSRKSLIRRKAGLQTAEGQAREKNINEKLERNYDIIRGKELEAIARTLYVRMTGFSVTEVGLCVHESSTFGNDGSPLDGFGASPDGLIPGDDDRWRHGLEAKAPTPEKLLEWIDGGILPEEHAAQVHMSMAVTGLREWHFIAYCPEMPLFIVRVKWDATTDRMLAELKKLHADYVTYRAGIDPKRVVRIGFVEEVAA